jgi:hypothetical protein
MTLRMFQAGRFQSSVNNFKDEVNDTVESLTVFSNEAKFKSFIEDARNSYLSAVQVYARW